MGQSWAGVAAWATMQSAGGVKGALGWPVAIVGSIGSGIVPLLGVEGGCDGGVPGGPPPVGGFSGGVEGLTGGLADGSLFKGLPGGPPGGLGGSWARAAPARTIVSRTASRGGAAVRSRRANNVKKFMVFLLPE